MELEQRLKEFIEVMEKEVIQGSQDAYSYNDYEWAAYHRGQGNVLKLLSGLLQKEEQDGT